MWGPDRKLFKGFEPCTMKMGDEKLITCVGGKVLSIGKLRKVFALTKVSFRFWNQVLELSVSFSKTPALFFNLHWEMSMRLLLF